MGKGNVRLALPLAEDGKERRAVLGYLRGPDAGYVEELRLVGGEARGELAEGAVGEDAVGGDRRLPGQVRAEGAQPLEHRPGGGGGALPRGGRGRRGARRLLSRGGRLARRGRAQAVVAGAALGH